MPLIYQDLQLPVLRGDRIEGQLNSVAPSMTHAVQKCGVAFPDDLCMITEESPKSYMEAVQTLGYCWKQEFKYDFPPFTLFEYRKRTSEGRLFDGPAEVATDDKTRSFLWVSGKPRCWQTIGACTFRLRGENWWLMWIWFHPDHRRKGHLMSAWPFFRAMFGVVIPEPPVSAQLIAFLRKVGYDSVLKDLANKLNGG